MGKSTVASEGVKPDLIVCSNISSTPDEHQYLGMDMKPQSFERADCIRSKLGLGYLFKKSLDKPQMLILSKSMTPNSDIEPIVRHDELFLEQNRLQTYVRFETNEGPVSFINKQKDLQTEKEFFMESIRLLAICANNTFGEPQ